MSQVAGCRLANGDGGRSVHEVRDTNRDGPSDVEYVIGGTKIDRHVARRRRNGLIDSFAQLVNPHFSTATDGEAVDAFKSHFATGHKRVFL